jgi:cytochrome c-type biogenesis protein
MTDTPQRLIDAYNIPMLTALLLGILTSVSPCPLATNIAAIAYLSKDAHASRETHVPPRPRLHAGAGRELHVGCSSSSFGPLCVPRLGLLPGMGGTAASAPSSSSSASSCSASSDGRAAATGNGHGGCRSGWRTGVHRCVSPRRALRAGLLSLQRRALLRRAHPHDNAGEERLLLPPLYAIGTGLPVILFSLLLAISVQAAGRAFRVVQQTEKYVRIVVAIVFLIIGAYYVWRIYFLLFFVAS